MADMTRIKGRIAETIYPNGKGAITAESHQALLLEMVDDINEKKADKEEVTTVAESVSILSQEVESNRINLTESLDALEQKLDNLPQGGGDFDPSGTYPNLTAGDLAGRGESVPASFGFRASGGKSIKDGRAYIKRIKGNSVVWNNMIDTRDRQGDGGYVYENDYLHLVEGHKYAMIREKTIDSFYCIPVINGSEIYDYVLRNGELAKIFTSAYTTTPSTTRMYCEQNIGKAILCDLTQMFQAGNEPSTIEEFNSRVATLGIDMYAYNEGQVIHCNTESIKSVGDNAWDEQWERGDINLTTGEKYDSNDYVRTKNPIKVIPNETYVIDAISSGRILFYDNMNAYIGKSDAFGNTTKITMPNNCHYIMYRWEGTTYNHDIMIRLDHSGWKSNTGVGYEPYWQDTLPLPIIRKYFPDGMKSAGTAHDEIRYNKVSGKWEYSKGKIKSVDMGSLDWQKWWYNEEGEWRIYAMIEGKEQGLTNLITSRHAITEGDWSMKDGEITGNDTNSNIYIKDSSFSAEGVDALIASLQGVILYYESNDWEWVELDAEDQNFRDYYQVADFGTEQSQSAVPSAAFSADIIYQFNAVDMIREHELEITELQKVIATMQAQLTSLINGGQ